MYVAAALRCAPGQVAPRTSAMQYAINFVLLGGFAVLSILLVTQGTKVYVGENPFDK
jgi:hypothetical protein